MTPISINLTPEQSAEVDAWQDGATYSFTATQTTPGQFTATEIGPAEEAAPEAEEAAAPTPPAPAGRPSSAKANPAIAILLGGKKAA